jgi:hypothetical protein
MAKSKWYGSGMAKRDIVYYIDFRFSPFVPTIFLNN